MDKDTRIYVTGHTGLAGSAVYRELVSRGYKNIITYTHDEFDLTNTGDTFEAFINASPEVVINCAAHAGGIKEAIDKPVQMLKDNLRIQTNIIEVCYEYGVSKLINLASSCIYPVDAPQPYTEEQLGDGKTDENWSYAIAKLAGIELCRAYHRQYGSDFISVVPCNMYGFNDNFNLHNSHVIPALISKFHNQDFSVWGNGKVKREFIYSDDFAKAVVMLMEECSYNDLHDGVINIGTGKDITIDALACTVNDIINHRIYTAKTFELSEPHGVKSKLMDCSRINALGWRAETSLYDGIRVTYNWYKDNVI